MELVQNILSQFEKSVQCAICLSTLKNPITTRCDHNFCSDCIRQALKGKVEIPCPLCKKTVKLRSLKHAVQLHSLVSTVNRVTNLVQERAGLPYTLSQSTRDGITDSVLVRNATPLSNGHVNMPEDSSRKNSDLRLLGANSPVLGVSENSVVNGNITSDTMELPIQENDDIVTSKNVEKRVTSDSEFIKNNIDKDFPKGSSSTCVETKIPLGMEKIEDQNTVTVSVDVHHSPLTPQLMIHLPNTPSSNIESKTANMRQSPTVTQSENSKVGKNLVNGSVITPHDNNNNIQPSEIINDPFEFPNSQKTNPANTTRSKNLQSQRKGKARNSKRKTPLSDGEKVQPLRKRLKKSRKLSSEPEVPHAQLTSSESEKASEITKLLEKSTNMKASYSSESEHVKQMLEKVENHPLTIENVTVSPKKGAKLIERNNKVRLKKIAKVPVKNGGKAKDKKQTVEYPKLTRRLLSANSSSASSTSEKETVVPHKQLLVKEHASQQSVKDKVKNWLETATPTASSDIQSTSPSSQSTQQESKTSDDDLISHSQVGVEYLPDRVITVRRRKVISPVKLDPQIQQSVRNQLWSRDAAVFGIGKPRNTFLSKNRKSLASALWPGESSTSSEDGRAGKNKLKKRPIKASKKKISLIEKAITIEGRLLKKSKARKKSPSPEKESIFNVPGLSQGVSPFSTPTKQSPTEINNDVAQIPEPSNQASISKRSRIEEPNVLNKAIKEIPTEIARENYEIQELDSTNVVPDAQPETSGTQKTVLQEVSAKDAIIATNALESDVEKKARTGEDINPDETEPCTSKHEKSHIKEKIVVPQKLPKTVKKPFVSTTSHVNDEVKTAIKSTTRSSNLPLLGDSPTVQDVSRKVPVVPTMSKPVGVELGLLDFSEPITSTSQERNKNVLNAQRPDAVVKTCRMVLEKFGDLTNIQTDITGGKNNSRARVSKTEISNKKNVGPSPDYETDDTVIPPSTSTVELELPPTPQHCNLNEIPQPLPVSTISDTDNTDTDAAKDVEMHNVVDTVVEILPDGSASSVAPDISDSFVTGDESVVTAANDQGTLQCLSNGWGGTKLRIFKSGSSGNSDDEDNSGFSVKKKSTEFSRFKSGSSGSALTKFDSKQKDVISVINSASQSLKFESSTANGVNCIPNNDSDCSKPVEENEQTINPVLQHIEDALAEADTTYINWADDPENPEKNQPYATTSGSKAKDKTPKKSSQTNIKKQNSKDASKGKITKSSPIKKQIYKKKAVGKRTKLNKVKFDNKKPSSADEIKINGESVSDDEYFNRSWPMEMKDMERFSCSLPNALPRSITDVVVRLQRIDPINLPSTSKTVIDISKIPLNDEMVDKLPVLDYEDETWNDVVDASPMLFETQQDNDEDDDDVGRPIEDKNTKGRVLNIDLRELNDINEQNTAILPDEIYFIDDNVGVIDDGADDVICCSWNDEEHRGETKVTSCHEDMSSIYSNEQLSQEGKSKEIHVDEPTDVSNVDVNEKSKDEHDKQYFKYILQSLQNICNINKNKLSSLFPQSSTILYQAIEICEKAKHSIEKENESREKICNNCENIIKKTNNVGEFHGNIVEVQSKNTSSGYLVASSASTNSNSKKSPRGRPRSRRRSQKRNSSRSSSRKSSECGGTSRKNRKNLNKKDDPTKSNKLHSSQTKKKSRLNTPIKNKHQEDEIESDRNGEQNHENRFNDEDDMTMFHDEMDIPQNTDVDVPDIIKDDLTASVEEAMIASDILDDESNIAPEIQQAILTDMNKNAPVVDVDSNGDLLEGINFDDDTHMNDTVDDTQESVKQDDFEHNINTSNIVAANVDSWLRRLSDLNKREGDKHKRKIGDRWSNPGSSDDDNVKQTSKTSKAKQTDTNNIPLEKFAINSAGIPNKIDTEKNSLAKNSEHSYPTTSKGVDHANSVAHVGNSSERSLSDVSVTTSKLMEKLDTGNASKAENSLQPFLDYSDGEDKEISQKDIGDDIEDMEFEEDYEIIQHADANQRIVSSDNEKKIDVSSKQALSNDSQKNESPKKKNKDDASNKVNGINTGLNFSSQASQQRSRNLLNNFSTKLLESKVVLEKLDDDVIINCSPPSETFKIDKRNAPKVQQWLESSQPEKASPPPSLDNMEVFEKLGFMTTGIQERGIELVRTMANKYNGQFFSKFDKDKVTHVIVNAKEHRTCDRTLKYLQGILTRKWIVSFNWVTDSLNANKKLPEEEYEIFGDNCMKEFESKGCEIPQGPLKARTSDLNFKLLKGFHCYCLPPYTLITIEQACQLLDLSGAVVAKNLGDLVANQNNDYTSLMEHRVVIVDAEVSSQVPDYTALGQQFGAVVISVEWLYDTISRFEVQPFEEFIVTGFTQDSELTSG